MTEDQALDKVIERWEIAAIHDDPSLYLKQNKCVLCELHNPCVSFPTFNKVTCSLFGRSVCSDLVSHAMGRLKNNELEKFRILAWKVVARVKEIQNEKMRS